MWIGLLIPYTNKFDKPFPSTPPTPTLLAPFVPSVLFSPHPPSPTAPHSIQEHHLQPPLAPNPLLLSHIPRSSQTPHRTLRYLSFKRGSVCSKRPKLNLQNLRAQIPAKEVFWTLIRYGQFSS